MGSDGGIETFLTEFLTVVAEARRRVHSKAYELMCDKQWSEVTSVLEPSLSNVGQTDQALGISGYVDGELSDVGGVAWIVEATRLGEGWELERLMTLNASDDPLGSQYRAATLPDRSFEDSRAFAEEFVPLVDELLRPPAPAARQA